uniref:hypothetical protein n=1 Tax=uncultured Clostridium sp. TaxID=59620 RepID=UPI002607ED60
MKKIIITAAVGIGLISLIPNSNFNKRKDNNLLLLSTKNISENIKEDINPFWFDYVTERVNIVTTSGKILNYEYFQGITGMRTNLPSGYAPIGYKIIGIRVNGENLTSKEVKEYKVPQILGDKDITIDYIVKLVDYTAIVKVHNKDGKIITEKSLGEKGSKIKYPTIDKGTKIISVTVNGKEIPISEIPKVINNKNLNIDIFTENKYKKPIKPSTDGDKKPDVVKP